jgi:hypothetical protein
MKYLGVLELTFIVLVGCMGHSTIENEDNIILSELSDKILSLDSVTSQEIGYL